MKPVFLITGKINEGIAILGIFRTKEEAEKYKLETEERTPELEPVVGEFEMGSRERANVLSETVVLKRG